MHIEELYRLDFVSCQSFPAFADDHADGVWNHIQVSGEQPCSRGVKIGRLVGGRRVPQSGREETLCED